jgi:hypothetical protein
MKMTEQQTLSAPIYWKMSSLIRDGIKERLDLRAGDEMTMVQRGEDYADVHGEGVKIIDLTVCFFPERSIF